MRNSMMQTALRQAFGSHSRHATTAKAAVAAATTTRTSLGRGTTMRCSSSSAGRCMMSSSTRTAQTTATARIRALSGWSNGQGNAAMQMRSHNNNNMRTSTRTYATVSDAPATATRVGNSNSNSNSNEHDTVEVESEGIAGVAESNTTVPSLATLVRQLTTPSAPTHPSLYATVLIHGRPYLVTAGDRLRLPFRMAGVQPGDEVRLDRVGVVGSRQWTVAPEEQSAKAINGAHEAIEAVPGVSVTAVVLGVESEPLRIKVKTKRRNRRSRTVRSKHQYTVLRIQDVVVE